MDCFSNWNDIVVLLNFKDDILSLDFFRLFRHHNITFDQSNNSNNGIFYHVRQTVENSLPSKMGDIMKIDGINYRALMCFW